MPWKQSLQSISLASVVALGLASGSVHAQTFEIMEATIADVHAAFASGELTCRALVEAYIERIEGLDDQLNAILAIHPDALTIADNMDVEFTEDPNVVGSLHCVPIIVKDNYDTADMLTTGASLSLEDHQPQQDAFTIAQLRDAGALILAKSNLTEFAMGGTTISSLGGQTNNPYDLTRTPGGSSGGTGASIAANMGLVGTGSDTGQSTRSPASAQSLVGLRATRGMISRTGILPLSVTQDEAGPITRTVEDNARMFDVMAGYDPADPITAFSYGRIPETYTACLDPDGLQGARIGVLRDFFGEEEINAEVNEVTEAAIDEMSELGATMIDIRIPDLSELTSGMGTGAFETGPAMEAYFVRANSGSPITSIEDILASGLYHPDIEDSLTNRRNVDNLEEEPDYTAIFYRRDNLRRAVMAVMAENELDAIFYPHQRRLVAPIGEPQLERNGVLSNATGFPALTLPGGFSSPSDDAPIGVPVGVELLGSEYSECELFRLGYAFEQGTQLRRPPQLEP